MYKSHGAVTASRIVPCTSPPGCTVFPSTSWSGRTSVGMFSDGRMRWLRTARSGTTDSMRPPSSVRRTVVRLLASISRCARLPVNVRHVFTDLRYYLWAAYGRLWAYERRWYGHADTHGTLCAPRRLYPPSLCAYMTAYHVASVSFQAYDLTVPAHTDALASLVRPLPSVCRWVRLYVNVRHVPTHRGHPYGSYVPASGRTEGGGTVTDGRTGHCACSGGCITLACTTLITVTCKLRVLTDV